MGNRAALTLYLDNSFLNRFFDDLALGANKLERDVLLRVLDQVHTGDIHLGCLKMVTEAQFCCPGFGPR